jgi:hypothetical protein
LSGIASGVGVGVIRGLGVRMSSWLRPYPLPFYFCADAEFGTDPLLASHWAVGTFVVVSLGTWSVLDFPSWRRRPDSETTYPLAQDDMSAEYLGGTKAGADCRRTIAQASARKAEGRGDAAVTILIHGCIFATRKKHAYLYPRQSSPLS